MVSRVAHSFANKTKFQNQKDSGFFTCIWIVQKLLYTKLRYWSYSLFSGYRIGDLGNINPKGTIYLLCELTLDRINYTNLLCFILIIFVFKLKPLDNALFFSASAVLPFENVNVLSLKIFVQLVHPCFFSPFINSSSSLGVNGCFWLDLWLVWNCNLTLCISALSLGTELYIAEYKLFCLSETSLSEEVFFYWKFPQDFVHFPSNFSQFPRLCRANVNSEWQNYLYSFLWHRCMYIGCWTGHHSLVKSVW